MHVASAQPHEMKLAKKTLASNRIPKRIGRPKQRFQELVADKAYFSQAFRRELQKRGIKVTIPDQKNRKKKKGHHGHWATDTSNVGKWNIALHGWTITKC